jgi:hypothetical protein
LPPILLVIRYNCTDDGSGTFNVPGVDLDPAPALPEQVNVTAETEPAASLSAASANASANASATADDRDFEESRSEILDSQAQVNPTPAHAGPSSVIPSASGGSIIEIGKLVVELLFAIY